MKNIYDGLLSFKGEWRTYQQRVLREADAYMDDGRVHITAAPGAGKTVLGIELIRRTGKPCLILSPRIVIRQQWLERIRGSFFTEKAKTWEENEEQKILSSDIRYPGMITSITYQTLYSAMAGEKNVEESGEGEGTEEINFAGFEFLRQVKKAGIRTVCLDECHHLKNEWWKALEKFMDIEKDMTVIALTATPPYDSTPAQWERYTKMCGPVDAEITVPELVKEGSLCPHQDYVWFNCPSQEEGEKISQFRQNAANMFVFLMNDASLGETAASHPALKDYEGYCDRMLENPGYLSGLLIYCQAKRIPFSRRWPEVLGVSEMPPVSEKWMEYFLQGFLYDDADSYQTDQKYREALKKQLREAGLTEKNKVHFLVNDKIEKMLVNSSGKMDSILKIASCEHTAMGEKLRMLILTDYIRGEYKSAVGHPEKDVGTMGVVPVFELLRRRGAGWRAGVLCGSLVILPDTAEEAFTEEILRIDPAASVPVFQKFRDAGETAVGYSEVPVKGKLSLYTRAVTKIFERGYIQILVGTKSLLGEGWDSPGINSLILASTVGSYVLGNQMRGRAIRINPQDPEKVSNIWHLVCMSAPQEEKDRRRMGIEEPELSEDFYTLQRRMDGVLGVSYDGTVIENGLGRMQTIRKPFTKKHIEKINEDTACRSADRSRVAGQWKSALVKWNGREIADEFMADRKNFRPGVGFINALGVQIMIILGELLNIYLFLLRTGNASYVPFAGLTMIFLLLSYVSCGKIIRQLTPMWRFRGMSRGVLAALKKAGYITSGCEVISKEEDGIWFGTWLRGGTDREKNLYADTFAQMLAPVENQRYLLCHGGNVVRAKEYFCVPDIFASARDKAEIFRMELIPYIGKFRLVYTRNPEGRKILLHARAKAFSNKNERRTDRKKCVKGMLE